MAKKGDIKKMYNCVLLEEADSYIQCFLCRDLSREAEPSTYQMLVNNIEVKPAGAIATVALQKSAAMHKEKFSEALSQVVKVSYMDDLGLTAKDEQELTD